MQYSLTYKFANLLRKRGYNFKENARPEVVQMQEDIASLENHGINFNIQAYPDGSWVARSTNVDGILTGSRTQSELQETIKDAIFTYYGIPARYCKDSLLRNTSEPVMQEQNVHVTA